MTEEQTNEARDWEQNRRRKHQINVRLSDDENEMLADLEEWTGETVAGMVRRWLRKEHRRLKKEHEPG